MIEERTITLTEQRYNELLKTEVESFAIKLHLESCRHQVEELQADNTVMLDILKWISNCCIDKYWSVNNYIKVVSDDEIKGRCDSIINIIQYKKKESEK